MTRARLAVGASNIWGDLVDRSAPAGLAVALLVVAGCRSPWPGAETVQSLPIAQVSHDVATDAPLDSSETVSGETASGGSDAQSQEAALAGVLDELEEIEAIEPAAKARLMDDLRAAKRENWSLIIRQFKSALAYRRQLAAREMSKLVVDTAAAGVLPTRHVPQPSFPTTPTFPTTSTPDAMPVSFDHHEAPAITGAAQVVSPPGAVIATDAKSPGELVPTEEAPAHEQRLPPHPNPLRTTPVAAEMPAGDEQQASFVADVATPQGWRTHLDAAIAELERSAKPTPDTTSDVHEQMRLRMLHLVAGQEEAAMAPISGASAAEQDYWGKQLFALSTYFDLASQPDAKRRAAGSLVHLDQARAKLAELATLQVRNLSFVDSVDGYGLFDLHDQAKFRPGEQVGLYAEVENFRSESTKEGYRTALGTSYEVVDANGQRVDHRQFPEVKDVCTNVRRDFHMEYGVDLPTRIYPGKYELRLIITDQLSHKIGQASVPFEIVE